MSDKKESGKAAAGADGDGKKGKSKLLIIVGAAVALLLAGSAAAYVMIGKKKDAEVASAAADAADEEADGKDPAQADKAAGADGKAAAHKPAKKKAKGKKKKKPEEDKPVFVDSDPFTVNLHDVEPHMALLKLTLMLEDEKVSEDVKTRMPQLRNNILLLLGSKNSADLLSREGKEKLAEEITATLNQALEDSPAADSIKGVLFQQIIVQ